MGKQVIKIFLFTDGMIVYKENLKESTKNIELIFHVL
jgi:hypothetical protein